MKRNRFEGYLCLGGVLCSFDYALARYNEACVVFALGSILGILWITRKTRQKGDGLFGLGFILLSYLLILATHLYEEYRLLVFPCAAMGILAGLLPSAFITTHGDWKWLLKNMRLWQGFLVFFFGLALVVSPSTCVAFASEGLGEVAGRMQLMGVVVLMAMPLELGVGRWMILKGLNSASKLQPLRRQ